jgi:hypothetical protein
MVALLRPKPLGEAKKKAVVMVLVLKMGLVWSASKAT